MVYSLSYIKERINPVCKESGVSKLLLFGSYANGNATENSDIDFIVCDNTGKLKGTLFYAFVGDLRELFYPKKVEVIESSEKIDWLDKVINNEGVVVYES